MALDPAKEFSDRDAFEKERMEKFAGMQALIRSSSEKFLTLEHNGIKIRIRPALPATARSGILKLARKYKDVDVEQLKDEQAGITNLPDGFFEDSIEQLYKSLAAFCLDEPYTNPEAWRYFDEMTGEAELIYKKIEVLVEEAHKTAISFLEKSGGPGAD